MTLETLRVCRPNQVYYQGVIGLWTRGRDRYGWSRRRARYEFITSSLIWIFFKLNIIMQEWSNPRNYGINLGGCRIYFWNIYHFHFSLDRSCIFYHGQSLEDLWNFWRFENWKVFEKDIKSILFCRLSSIAFAGWCVYISQSQNGYIISILKRVDVCTGDIWLPRLTCAPQKSNKVTPKKITCFSNTCNLASENQAQG